MLGRNLAFERRGAGGRFDLLPGPLDELVASKVDIIVAIGYPAAFMAKTRTTLPIVVFSTGDPVGTGLVTSLARPSGNVTNRHFGHDDRAYAEAIATSQGVVYQPSAASPSFGT